MPAIHKIGVTGAGNMGNGIAQKIIQEGIAVVLVDVDVAFVPKGVNTIKHMPANAIIDRQVGQPVAEAVEIELARLDEIFTTADALEGLISLGRKRPEYKGV